jgi:hypothetical protein
MARYKTEFRLEHGDEKPSAWFANIVGDAPANKPYVSFTNDDIAPMFIPDKDLERFAVNILKALKSKHLKP